MENRESKTAPASANAPDFAELVRLELSLEPDARVEGKTWLESPPRQLFGVSLSGGGIRSATFNLGLLQGLNELGFLKGFDYLATVSGGGYTGAFWTRWRGLERTGGKVGPEVPSFPEQQYKSDANPGFDGNPEPHEIRHLRRFSRFLSPSLGAFSFDTGRMLMALINAIVPSVVGATTFLMLAMLASIGIAWLVLVAPMGFAQVSAFGATAAVHYGGVAAMLAFGTMHVVAMWQLWAEGTDSPRRLLTTSIVLLAILALMWGLRLGADPTLPARALHAFAFVPMCQPPACLEISPAPAVWAYAAQPALILLLVPMLLAPFRIADKGRGGTMRPFIVYADQVSSWLLFAAMAWLALVALWWLAFFVASNDGMLGEALRGLTIGGVPLGALVAWLSRFVGRVTSSSESRGQRLGRWGVIAAGYLAVGAMVVGAMLVMITVHRNGWWGPWALVTAAGLALVLLLFDPNRIGLHEFYRGRIARGFLGAARARGTDDDNRTEEHPDDDVILPALQPALQRMPGPVHLVVCAANNLTPKDALGSLSRGAEPAVLSPVGLSVGERWAAWPHGSSQPGATAAPRLSQAVTASAAAFNTQMGSKSKVLGPTVAFLMTSLGLRLGLWVRNPAWVREGQPVVRRSRGFAMVRELLGLSDSRRDEWVFLSDGGHFDNTGAYELVRRHCRYILISDCGADNERAFDDLGSLVRRVREDFGVDIKISLDPLRPGPDGLSRQPMVAGDIHYPDGDTGTLLVIKPTITGAEPPDVLQYRARNAQFPHESTGDQFFDEAQWESYRRLGQHTVRSAFALARTTGRHPALGATIGDLAMRPRGEVQAEMRRVFGEARREWFARPVDYQQRVERLARAIGALDAALPSSGPRLSREVYWELPVPPPAGRTLEGGAPSVDDHIRTVAALRQALVTFESIFLSESLATQHNQPMYTGIINLMARWLSSPLMRGWWPLLSATCGVGFRQFVEAHFLTQLDGTRRLGIVTEPDANAVLVASRHRGNHAQEPDVTLHLQLTLPGEPTAAGARSAVTLEVARLDATRIGPDGDEPGVVIWDARECFVPPGLWGIGLGSQLVRALRPQREADAGDEPAILDELRASHQIAVVRTFWSGTPEEKKDSADLQQLYLDAGFTTATAHALTIEGVHRAYVRLRERCRLHAPYLPEATAAWSLASAATFLDENDIVLLHRWPSGTKVAGA